MFSLLHRQGDGRVTVLFFGFLSGFSGGMRIFATQNLYISG